MDHIIYEDTPQYSRWRGLRIKIFLLLFLVVLASGISYRVLIIGAKSIQDVADILVILVVFMLLGVFFWSRSPRKYLVFDDRLKIVMGGPFSTIIPFNSLEAASEATSEDLRFGRGISKKNAVLIIRRLESATIITPSNRALFLEYLNKALSEWKNKMEVSTEADRGG